MLTRDKNQNRMTAGRLKYRENECSLLVYIQLSASYVSYTVWISVTATVCMRGPGLFKVLTVSESLNTVWKKWSVEWCAAGRGPLCGWIITWQAGRSQVLAWRVSRSALCCLHAESLCVTQPIQQRITILQRRSIQNWRSCNRKKNYNWTETKQN